MASSRNTSFPLVDEMRPETHWWTVPVNSYGGDDGGQDVCVRLVQNSIKDQKAGRSPLLALVAAHSGPFMTCCQLFRDMNKRFEEPPRPTCTLHQVTIQVDGDDIAIVPYIDCKGNDLFEKKVEIKASFTMTVARVYKEVGDGKYVLLKNSDRYALLKDWSLFMERLCHRETLGRTWERHAKAKMVIFNSLPQKIKMDLLVIMADHGSFATFGKPEELLQALFKNLPTSR